MSDDAGGTSTASAALLDATIARKLASGPKLAATLCPSFESPCDDTTEETTSPHAIWEKSASAVVYCSCSVCSAFSCSSCFETRVSSCGVETTRPNICSLSC